ncbi:MAG: hypothetical protein AMS18_00375 [Gemmatimonas sp. SG8_17]|nr:MAG: hypothetical protein AMS18_00375 [Gemmatimonas sp. SG8_17]
MITVTLPVEEYNAIVTARKDYLTAVACCLDEIAAGVRQGKTRVLNVTSAGVAEYVEEVARQIRKKRDGLPVLVKE